MNYEETIYTPDENICNESENENNKIENIKEFGCCVTDSDSPIHCLSIIGQVEGHYILPSSNKTTKY